MRPKSNIIFINFLIYKMIWRKSSIIRLTSPRLRVDFLKKKNKEKKYEIFCVKIWPQRNCRFVCNSVIF
jgi:hypothetical protein